MTDVMPGAPEPGPSLGRFDLLARSVAALLVAIVSGHAGPEAQVWAATMQPAVEDLLRYRGARSGEQVERMLEEACHHADKSIEDLVDLASGDDGRLELFTHAIQAALSTLRDDNVHLLGRVLAEGLTDDARLDVSRVVTDALRDLEAPHVAVLHAMVTQDRPSVPRDQGGERGPDTWSHAQIELAVPRLTGGSLPVISTLARHGMVLPSAVAVLGGGPESPSPLPAWVVTDFGRLCLRRLEEVAAEDHHEPDDHRATQERPML